MAPYTISGLLAAGAGLAYGLFYLGIALLYSVTQKEFWQGRKPSDKILHEQASRKLWSLQEDLESIRHEFLKLADDTQLHYLSSIPQATSTRTLVIFLHGFPDSSHLFAEQLRSPLAKKAQLISLDLPGCGGSDSIERYGPNEVLNVISEAIVLLKERYLAHPSKEGTRCILVGHDWGGVIGFRLAAETSNLFDHYIAINSLHPAFAKAQLERRIKEAKAALKEWRFQTAAKLIAPVLSQLGKSSYTYMVTLPLPLAKLIPSLTLSLVRFAHSLEYKGKPPPSPEELATRLAMACGPGPKESISTAEKGSAYGPSVYARSKTAMPGDWDGRVKLYAQGLLRKKWTPSYPGYVAGKVLPAEFEGKHFKCPVSFMFGLQDIALDPRIAVDGIENYFIQEEKASRAYQKSRVIRLSNCGHWSLLEKDGLQALNEVLQLVV